MLVIPAIDLKDGQCVRLRQGLMDDSTFFPITPRLQQRVGLKRVRVAYIWLI